VSSTAATVSTSANATSADTSAARNRLRRAPPVVPRMPSASSGLRSGRTTAHAGASATTMPVKRAMPPVNVTTRQSIRTDSSLGMPAGARANRVAVADSISDSAAAAPAAPNSTPSTSVWRRSRRRPAPSAARTASSRFLVALRASSRLATFTQATRSTTPTPASRTRSSGRIAPTTCSCSGTSDAVQPLVSAGEACAISSNARRRSARARSTPTSSFSRPITLRLRGARDPAARASSRGTQTSTSAEALNVTGPASSGAYGKTKSRASRPQSWSNPGSQPRSCRRLRGRPRTAGARARR
jgi:hypothetical protein